ncbi:ImmA/IrrE family metallo-endopeptidase [Acetobacter syzygii]|uniref:ImmA/IrrE family metallo-endopeptidase n=1 Tax=Acetobacter syzygii TaxID=146476 RepID=UPI00156E60A2|nr:ImmA/IrrE family metallo-endopeptidase [Acetobacter syzygii]NSL93740.1 ImmA/IrrE family metallo-endopeptidase [Acetobacter syzygii]
MYERNLARDILNHFHMDTYESIDLDRIAEAQGIEIRDLADGDDDGASGWYREDDERPLILINRNRSVAHQRFTLAHELGHYFMKHGSRARDTYRQIRLREPEEVSANRFAAELLMPKEMVEEFLDQGLSAWEMARRFGVSDEAMGYRLHNLGYEYDQEYMF